MKVLGLATFSILCLVTSCAEPIESRHYGAIRFIPTILNVDDPKKIGVQLNRQATTQMSDSLSTKAPLRESRVIGYPYILDSLTPGTYDLNFMFVNAPSPVDSSKLVYDTIDGKVLARELVSDFPGWRIEPTTVYQIRIGADSMSVVEGNLVRPNRIYYDRISYSSEFWWDGKIYPRSQ